MGFEVLGSDVNLQSRSHESRFKESIENAYLSPRKRRKVCQEVKNLPRHTARLSKPGTWPSSSPSLPRRGRLDTAVARTLSRHTAQLSRQGIRPSSLPFLPQGSRLDTTVAGTSSRHTDTLNSQGTRPSPSPSLPQGSRLDTTVARGAGLRILPGGRRMDTTPAVHGLGRSRTPPSQPWGSRTCWPPPSSISPTATANT